MKIALRSLVAQGTAATALVFLTLPLLGAAEKNKKPVVAVVNIPAVLAECRLLRDELGKIVKEVKKRNEALNKTAKKLRESREDILKRQASAPKNDSKLFTDRQVQARKEFFFKLDYEKLERYKKRLEVKAMQRTIGTIRDEIRKEAKARGIVLVLHCSDPNELWGMPATHKNASKGKDSSNKTDDKKETEILNRLRPKTWQGLVKRFGRNPILFDTPTVDITKAIIRRVNERTERSKQATGGEESLLR